MYGDGRVLFVCVPSVSDVTGAGGVAPRWRLYIKQLEENGWRVETWTVDKSGLEMLPRCVHPFYPKTLIDSPSPLLIWKLYHRLQIGDIACVLITDLFNDVNLALLCYGVGIPLVFSVHTDGSKLPGGVPWIATLSQAITARLSDALVTTSKSFAKVLEERQVWRRRGERALYYAPLNCSELPYQNITKAQIETERTRLFGGQILKTRHLLTYVGRWSAEKRIDLLIQVVQKANKKASITLAIVGDAADDKVAADLLQWHNPPSIIILRGMRRRGPELVATYLASDWIVSASDFETFGNVAHEAASVGVPAILQIGPGFIDQIPTGRSDRGVLIDFGHDKADEQLIQAIRDTQHLRPQDVRNAVDTQKEGLGVQDVLAMALSRHSLESSSIFFRFVAIFNAFIVASFLRAFCATYAIYLSCALMVSSLFPSLRKSLRPPSRRVRWAGALSLRYIWRNQLKLWRQNSNPQLNLQQEHGQQTPTKEAETLYSTRRRIALAVEAPIHNSRRGTSIIHGGKKAVKEHAER
uniref:Glycosyltransferase subfamily 4-like N-terminal domain-containing protein n=1 Tax=Aureoumbra lagunensis TaxID=44058 RepID=A0A7S3NJG9_9STRA